MNSSVHSSKPGPGRAIGVAFVALAVAVALVQLADIAMHAAIGQLEPLRIASNGLMLVGAAAAMVRRGHRLIMPVVAGCIVAYLVLNLLFVLLYGITNPEQEGQVRTALIALVALTVALSAPLVLIAGARLPARGR